MDRAVPPSPIASSRGWCNLSRVLRKVEEAVEEEEEASKERANPSTEKSFAASI